MPPYLLGTGQAEVMVSLVGLGILLAMPEVAKKAKEALGAKEGIFSELARAATGRAKGTMPVGTRLASLSTAGVAGLGGAAVGAGRAWWRGDENVPYAARQGFKDTAGTILGGREFKPNIPLIGPTKFSTPGLVGAASAIDRSVGVDKPDVLNPLVNAVDNEWDPDSQKLRQFMQAWEDMDQKVSQREKTKEK